MGTMMKTVDELKAMGYSVELWPTHIPEGYHFATPGDYVMASDFPKVWWICTWFNGEVGLVMPENITVVRIQRSLFSPWRCFSPRCAGRLNDFGKPCYWCGADSK